MIRAIVVAGGDRDVDAVPREWSDALVIGADSGVDFAHALRLRVDVAVGDFDSVSPEGLARAESAGARVERYPNEKDETDLELALDAARVAGATHVLVLGIGGGRFDHLLGNVLLLAAERYAAMRIEARTGTARVLVVRGGQRRAELPGDVGDLVTLLAVGGPAAGITTEGLQYPLHRETLVSSTSRGLSNVIESTPAAVELEDGTLLAVLPGR